MVGMAVGQHDNLDIKSGIGDGAADFFAIASGVDDHAFRRFFANDKAVG